MLGTQRRFVRRCEWLIDFPNCGDFPQTSQTADMTDAWYQARPPVTSQDSTGAWWPRGLLERQRPPASQGGTLPNSIPNQTDLKL